MNLKRFFNEFVDILFFIDPPKFTNEKELYCCAIDWCANNMEISCYDIFKEAFKRYGSVRGIKLESAFKDYLINDIVPRQVIMLLIEEGYLPSNLHIYSTPE